MSIEFHDPRANPLIEAMPYTLSSALEGEVAIGLLANGFPDSEVFLDAIENSLSKALPNANIKRYNKNGASVPANDTMMEQIQSECDVFLSAYGH